MSKKNTKRALLTSVLAMLLCLTMLMGSTLAWFTDSASTGVNTITAGNLDIDLVGEDGTTLVGETLSFVKAAGHEAEEILWEPGCTYNLQKFKIVNKGNLAVKFKVTITGIVGDEGLNRVIDWTITDKDGNVVSFDEPISLEKETDTGFYTISGHMQESAGNEYMKMTIAGATIDVKATQDTVEYDSFNNTYDAGAWLDMQLTKTEEGAYKDEETGDLYVKDGGTYVPVTEDPNVTGLYTAVEGGAKYAANDTALNKAVEQGGNIGIIQNISETFDSNDTYQPPKAIGVSGTGKEATVDLGGNNLDIKSNSGANGISAENGAKLNVSNGTVTMDKAYGTTIAVVDADEGEITLDNMEVTLTAESGICVSASSDGGKIVIKDSTVNGPNTKYSNAVFCGSQSTTEIYNSIINGSIKVAVNGKMELHGGDYTAATIYNEGTITIYSGKFSSDPRKPFSSGFKGCTIASGSTISPNADGTWTVTAG